MYRFENLLAGLLMIGLIGVGAVFSFYMLIFILPVLLCVGGGYLLYHYIQLWRLKKKFQQSDYFSDFKEEKTKDDKVIDAEFEIIEEKIRK